MSRSHFTLLFFICLACLLAPALANASSLLQAEENLYSLPIEQRLHPDLRQEPLRWRGFFFSPHMNVSSRYNSNVRALNNQGDSDYSLILTPEITIQKAYKNHALKAGLKAEIEQFSDLKDENHQDIDLFLNGNFEMNRRWSIPVSLGAQKYARSRATPQQQATTQRPEDIYKARSSIGLTRNFNRLSLSLIGNIEDITHENGISLNGQNRIIYSDDDRTNISALFRARYGAVRGKSADSRPEHILFADLKIEDQTYRRGDFTNGAFTGVKGDNQRMGGFLGFETRYKDKLFAHIGAGYTHIDYDALSLKDTGLVRLEGEFSIMPYRRLSLNGRLNRQINQDNDYKQGFKETNIELGADLEMLHNLYLGAKAGYSYADFIDSNRADDHYMADIGVRYHNSRRLETALNLRYDDRQSTQQGQDFDRMQILLSLIGKL